MLAIFSRDQP